MSKPIEDYGFIGNMLSCALVARDGSIDWLCLPRFDSDACFAALLGTERNGRWKIAPVGNARISRRYRPGTPILETSFETQDGTVTIIDFMPLAPDEEHVDVIRIIRGDRGRVRMSLELALRFDYGQTVPWVRRTDYGLRAEAGPNAVELRTPVALQGRDMMTFGEFTIGEGAQIPFALTWHPSHRPAERRWDPAARLAATEQWWRDWSSNACFSERDQDHPWRDAVSRSLVTLKALTFQPTGGIVAAATTSLPEEIGGTRNWDYRFCWVRDATLTLLALLASGYRDEARAWREWMLRAAAGHPNQFQIMYGLSGERRLTEVELPWLEGYEGSRPVRIGNAAYDQLQIDAYGEVMDALHVGRRYMLEPSETSWGFQIALLEDLESKWREPDEGIWEVRGGRRHFTHSKVMAWVAFDRGIRAVEDYGLAGPVEHWRKIREEIRVDILKHGWCESRRSFVQSYGSKALDAALLLVPIVGFLPPDDPRVLATVEAIQRDLVVDGLVMRYRSDQVDDGVDGAESTFLVCSFWLADALTMIGRLEEAEALFERLLSLRNDLGLLAEEYDPGARRQLGNFPQAFSHIGLINTANNLASARGPAEQRADRASPIRPPARSSASDRDGTELLE